MNLSYTLKSFFILLFFITININSLFADYYDSTVSNKVINFASYCKLGKITVFEMSTPGCHPCETLKNFLLDKQYDMTKVDIYHLVIGSGKATKMWGYSEGITAVPVVYFFGPTKNPIKVLHVLDKDYSLNKIDEVINNLIESLVDFNPQLLYEKKEIVTTLPIINLKDTGTNSTKSSVEELRNKILKLEDSLDRMGFALEAFKNSALIADQSYLRIQKSVFKKQDSLTAILNGLRFCEIKDIEISQLNMRKKQTRNAKKTRYLKINFSTSYDFLAFDEVLLHVSDTLGNILINKNVKIFLLNNGSNKEVIIPLNINSGNTSNLRNYNIDISCEGVKFYSGSFELYQFPESLLQRIPRWSGFAIPAFVIFAGLIVSNQIK